MIHRAMIPMSRSAMIPVIVAVLTAVSFLPALGGSFLNWDDNVNFLDNPGYRGLGHAQIRWAFSSVLFGHYIPVTRLTWSLNYVLGGMDPWGYHLVNVLLHAANAAIFYLVARRLLAAAIGDGAQRDRHEPHLGAAAAVAALVFGVHPLRVEPVAWITGRADVLCTTFALLAVWAYLRGVEGGGPARPGAVLISTAAFAAALLSKGAALPLPAALFLLDVYPLRRVPRLGWRLLLKEKIPVLLVMLAGAGTALYAVSHGAVLTHASTYGVIARVTAAGYSFLIALLRFIWPAWLSPLYEMPPRISLLEPRFGLAVAAAVLITAVLIALRRRWPAGLAAWTFSALMLAPTSAAFRHGAELAPDRYTYLSGLGFAVLVGGAALALIRLARRGVLSPPMVRIAAIGGAAAIVCLGTATWSLAEVWRESETLWRWAVELNPDCSVCHGKLGESALGGPGGAGRAGEAEGIFRRAIALRPEIPEPYFNLGTALALQGRYAEAEGPLRAYMERVPEAAAGPERLGLLYLVDGRYGAAIPLLRNALVRRPDAPGLRGYLAQALPGRGGELRAQGRDAEAEALLVEARSLGEDAAGPSRSRGMAPARALQPGSRP